MSAQPRLTLSIVSHAQGSLVAALLEDLAAMQSQDFKVVLTLNLEEERAFVEHASAVLPLTVLSNATPKGFAANHNTAFSHCDTPYFCVLNPDLRMQSNPFPALMDACTAPEVGLVAPLVVDEAGNCEDSARRFPTPLSVAARVFQRERRLDYGVPRSAFSPDWVAGMCMLMRSDTYRAVGGFDERYFLYYEDADLCRRLRRRGLDVRLIPQVRVIHLARRQSRRNLRYLRWHFASMLRFLFLS
jgi:N-acetylglucosaminyl-diphospho-decaprenol L-rhamnosyltransferase